MNQLSVKLKGGIMLLFVFVVLPTCLAFRVQQLNEQEQNTNTVNYYEK